MIEPINDTDVKEIEDIPESRKDEMPCARSKAVNRMSEQQTPDREKKIAEILEALEKATPGPKVGG